MWIRELQAGLASGAALHGHDTPVCLSVYATTNGELANLHRQPVFERWALKDLE